MSWAKKKNYENVHDYILTHTVALVMSLTS